MSPTNPYVKYDPTKFIVERAQFGSAHLNILHLGEARLGREVSLWVPLQTASFTYASSYQPDANNTLIVDQETANCSLKFWGDPDDDALLYCGDKIRASYDGTTIFIGIVESVSMSYAADPEARDHGAAYAVELSASIVGAYATAMNHTVTWTEIPEETFIERIRRWVTVDNWTD